MRLIAAVIIAVAVSAPSVPSGTGHSAEAQARLDKYLAGRIAGETRHCLAVDKTDHPIAIDDYTMLFRDGPRIWRTELSGSFECGRIDPQATIITESGLRRLCEGSKLVFQSGSLSGACYLGEFTPYTKP